jgi:hypothetical protein
MAVLKKLHTELLYDSPVPLFSIYRKGYKAAYNRATCTPFITALFKTAELWNQPGCPPTDEWIKKM